MSRTGQRDEEEVKMANRVVMKICGEELILRTEDSPEYVHKVGQYVNELVQTAQRQARVGLVTAALLTAANIADEMFKTREADEQLRSQIKGYLEESSRAKAEISDLKREVLRLQKAQKKMEKQDEKPVRTARAKTARTRTAREEQEAGNEPEGGGISSKTPRMAALLSGLEPETPKAPETAEAPKSPEAQEAAKDPEAEAPKETVSPTENSPSAASDVSASSPAAPETETA